MTQDTDDVIRTQIRDSAIMTRNLKRFKLVHNVMVMEHLERWQWFSYLYHAFHCWTHIWVRDYREGSRWKINSPGSIEQWLHCPSHRRLIVMTECYIGRFMTFCSRRKRSATWFQCFSHLVSRKSWFVLLHIEPVAVYKSQVARTSLCLNHLVQITVYTPLHGF